MVVGNVPEAVDLVVIGGGPGGYTAALRGAKNGRRVVLIDHNGAQGIGGVCLQVGCIPSKALIEMASLADRARAANTMGLSFGDVQADLGQFQTWKGEVVGKLTAGVRGLLTRAGIEIVAGTASFTDKTTLVVSLLDGQVQFLQFKDLILATGSRPIELPALPFDGDVVLDSTGALALTEVPASVAVVGGGYIGLEIGTALAKLGSSVTLVEALDRILPTLEEGFAKPVARRLEELGVSVIVGAVARQWNDGYLMTEKDGRSLPIPADKVIVAVGRKPNTDALGLEAFGHELASDGLLHVASDRRLTPHIAAIGDITPGPALAHKAIAEAVVAADALCAKKVAFDPQVIPAVVFSDPEIASVGLTANQAKSAGIEAVAARIPVSASGRAATLNDRLGFAECVCDKSDGTLLGLHIVSPHASDLIAEGAVAIELGATAEDLSLIVHAHPTLSELVADAAHLLTDRLSD